MAAVRTASSSLIGLAALVLLLAGCTEKPADRSAVAKAADAALRTAIEETKAVKDPWAAFKQLDSRETAALTNNNPCVAGQCATVPAWDISRAERLRYLTAAVDAGSPEAFTFLYGPGARADDEYAGLRRASVAKLLAAADNAPGRPEDQQLLRLAAAVSAEGRFSVMDTGKAVGYYARAWAAGDAAAANSVAVLFASINDTRNAYLWSLRCLSTCARSAAVDLPTLQQRLSPEAAKQAQAAARNTSVVELDTTGG